MRQNDIDKRLCWSYIYINFKLFLIIFGNIAVHHLPNYDRLSPKEALFSKYVALGLVCFQTIDLLKMASQVSKYLYILKLISVLTGTKMKTTLWG
jgi:hypothetical protein